MATDEIVDDWGCGGFAFFSTWLRGSSKAKFTAKHAKIAKKKSLKTALN